MVPKICICSLLDIVPIKTVLLLLENLINIPGINIAPVNIAPWYSAKFGSQSTKHVLFHVLDLLFELTTNVILSQFQGMLQNNAI